MHRLCEVKGTSMKKLIIGSAIGTALAGGLLAVYCCMKRRSLIECKAGAKIQFLDDTDGMYEDENPGENKH